MAEENQTPTEKPGKQIINIESLKSATANRAMQLALELYNLEIRRKAIKDELQNIGLSQVVFEQVSPSEKK